MFFGAITPSNTWYTTLHYTALHYTILRYPTLHATRIRTSAVSVYPRVAFSSSLNQNANIQTNIRSLELYLHVPKIFRKGGCPTEELVQ